MRRAMSVRPGCISCDWLRKTSIADPTEGSATHHVASFQLQRPGAVSSPFAIRPGPSAFLGLWSSSISQCLTSHWRFVKSRCSKRGVSPGFSFSSIDISSPTLLAPPRPFAWVLAAILYGLAAHGVVFRSGRRCRHVPANNDRILRASCGSHRVPWNGRISGLHLCTGRQGRRRLSLSDGRGSHHSSERAGQNQLHRGDSFS